MIKKAVILAAGLGSRLKPLTENEHKCMTKVCGMPIIQRTLKNLEKSEFEEVVIVVGYLKNKLIQQINEMKLALDIKFIVNPYFNESNTTLSLKYGIDEIKTEYDFLYIIEGDVVFEKKVIDRLINSKHENVSILEPYNKKLEGTFVELDSRNRIVDWRHKSDQEKNYKLEDKYKTVNIHKFSQLFVNNCLLKEIDLNLSKEGWLQPLEKVMKKIVGAYSIPIYGEVLNGEKWYEVDDLNDLNNAEKVMREN